ncbi:MAG: ornithine carbamoyltransferase [Leptospiraceae bacterium]|nr:ornithine carbamoyltransferase [Leptospiraceae bacterium]MCP5494639.1 ornithine carbamoyltransferase [Leptospiraceae bacterium]
MFSKEVNHLITWDNWSDEDIIKIIDLAVYVKENRAFFSGHMRGRSMAMLFQKTSTRTRVSFEAGMTEMGGHAIYMDWMTSNFQLSDIDLEAKYLSRNVSIIMARLKKHEDLLTLKSGCSVPLINGCCNLFHPCQALADMLTIKLHAGKLKGMRLCYIGVHNNVVNSLIAVTAACGVHLTLVTPLLSNPNIKIQSIIDKAMEKKTLTWENDLHKAIKDADYIYTDTWVDMEFFNDPASQKMKEERIKTMIPYQINSEVLKHTRAFVMHDMPIHSGYEITRDVVLSDRSIVFPQAENRLDAQKAIILTLLNIT